MLKTAIVKEPSKSFQYGITTAHLGNPTYDKALLQHQNYIKSLKKAGLNILCLNAEEKYPDSTFVEDTAIVNDRLAIITKPGAESRVGETKSVEIELKGFYKTIHKIDSAGTVDGGDILKVNDHYFIGITKRTNEEGASQLEKILNEYNFTTSRVYLDNILHLKTGISYLGDYSILAWKEIAEKKEIKEYCKENNINIIYSDPKELYSANSLRINNYVIIPEGYPILFKKLNELDFNVIKVKITEFQKMDGGLSCLSLRF